MKNYRLAVDENGSPFVLNSKGSIDFGYITEEMNLTPAPIRVAEGNEDYGLAHIELRHGEQLRNNGFRSAYDFVEFVTTCFDSIKQGHNDTLFIKLVRDIGYWKVISGGVFNIRYSRKKKEIYSGSDNRPPQPAPDGEGLGLSRMQGRIIRRDEQYNSFVEILFSVCKYIKIHSKSIVYFILSLMLRLGLLWHCDNTGGQLSQGLVT